MKINQPFAIKPSQMTTSYDVTASRVISRANVLRPLMDCYYGDEHRNSYYKMEKIPKDRQHRPVLVFRA